MIKHVKIESFKSFDRIDLAPHPFVNVLIGPNSSGKSNFLNAISLNILKDIPFDEGNLEALQPLRPKGYPYVGFCLNLKFNNEFSQAISSNEGNLFDTLQIDNLSADIFRASLLREGLPINEYAYSKSILEHIGSTRQSESDRNKGEFFKDLIYNKFPKLIALYNIRVDRIREPKKVIKNAFFETDGSNLVGFFNRLINEYRPIAQLLFDDLYNLTNEFAYITTPPSDTPGEIELMFFDKNNKGYLSSEVSDGILYFTALLAIIYQPNPPKVIMLEEPENGIHPRRITEICNLIWKLAKEKNIQFFITTHSPVLLQYFADTPECVWVFDKEDGVTQIKNLQTDIIEPINAALHQQGVDEGIDFTTNLGENWMMGLIDGVPPAIFKI
jgi:AAA15 family ATPase/GTPase